MNSRPLPATDDGDPSPEIASALPFQAVLDAVPAPIWFKDAAGVYLGCNAAFEIFLGRPRAAIVGRRVEDVSPPDLAAVYRAADDELLRSGIVQVYETEVAYADGVRHRVIMRKSVLRDGDGAVIGLAGTMIDVTAQRAAEAAREEARRRAEQAERLATLGTVAAGVAHELANPLTFVLANLAWCADQARALAGPTPPDGAATQLVQALEETRQAADRMRIIVRDLKACARPDREVLDAAGEDPSCEPARAVEFALGLAWGELRTRARVVRELGDVPPVRADEARLGQVLVNLLLNAAQALPAGEASRHEVRVVARTVPDGRVALEVKDTGPGMTPEVQARAFDPFFTTKPPGKGTGLGLWICRELVAAQGGEIQLESAPGQGSTLRVLLAPAR